MPLKIIILSFYRKQHQFLVDQHTKRKKKSQKITQKKTNKKRVNMHIDVLKVLSKLKQSPVSVWSSQTAGGTARS